MYRFIIEGDVVPYTRMTQRGKWVRGDAQRYLDSQEAVAWQYKIQMLENGWEMLERRPIWIKVKFVVRKNLHRRDLTNSMKAIEDSAQGIVFPNDCWVDWAQQEREIGNGYVATVEIGYYKPAQILC